MTDFFALVLDFGDFDDEREREVVVVGDDGGDFDFVVVDLLFFVPSSSSSSLTFLDWDPPLTRCVGDVASSSMVVVRRRVGERALEAGAVVSSSSFLLTRARE